MDPSSAKKSEKDIVQINVLQGRAVRVTHGTVGVGRVHAINSSTFDRHATLTTEELLHLLAFQPLQALDVSPLNLLDPVELNSIGEGRNSNEFEIRFVPVPDGRLGVELEHIQLKDQFNLKLDARGFMVIRRENWSHHLSLGDVIVSVNETPVAFLEAATGFNLISQSTNRRFTIISKHEYLGVKKSDEEKSPPPIKRSRTYIYQNQQRPRHHLHDEDDAIEGAAPPTKENPVFDVEGLNASQQARSYEEAEEDTYEDDNSLRQQYRQLRRGYLCHSFYKPTRDRRPYLTLAHEHSSEAGQAESEYTQQFLAVAHQQRSAALKQVLLRKYIR